MRLLSITSLFALTMACGPSTVTTDLEPDGPETAEPMGEDYDSLTDSMSAPSLDGVCDVGRCNGAYVNTGKCGLLNPCGGLRPCDLTTLVHGCEVGVSQACTSQDHGNIFVKYRYECQANASVPAGTLEFQANCSAGLFQPNICRRDPVCENMSMLRPCDSVGGYCRTGGLFKNTYRYRCEPVEREHTCLADSLECTCDGDLHPDIDGDTIPNEIDPDWDGDGLANEDDNCPAVVNTDQLDTDHDGWGDACDLDDDGDGVHDRDDPCRLLSQQSPGPGCEDDIDGDGIAASFDNCPYLYNPEQLDLDQDGEGDACEPLIRLAELGETCVEYDECAPGLSCICLDHLCTQRGCYIGLGRACAADAECGSLFTCRDATCAYQCPAGSREVEEQCELENNYAGQTPGEHYYGGYGTVAAPVVIGHDGRMWQGCPAGTEGPDCRYGEPLRRMWYDAVGYCEQLDWAGYSDWELPTVEALASTLDPYRYPPTIQLEIFPSTPLDGGFWAGDEPFYDGMEEQNGVWFGWDRWLVSPYDGGLWADRKGALNFIRCVRREPL